MKKRGRKASRQLATDALAGDFTRGFVATGLLSLLQERASPAVTASDGRRALRHALQGGVALASGAAAADALRRRDYPVLLAAVAGGAAGIMSIEHLLRQPAHDDYCDHREIGNEQEEA